jgi:hypothetical protein
MPNLSKALKYHIRGNGTGKRLIGYQFVAGCIFYGHTACRIQESVMIELVLLVCLASNPTECHKEWPLFESTQTSMHACMFEGQRQAVQWAEAHPKYRVRKWSCGLSGS